MSGYTAVIMAGGKGTRLSSVTNGEIPKPMVPVAASPSLRGRSSAARMRRAAVRVRRRASARTDRGVLRRRERVRRFGALHRRAGTARFGGALFYLKDAFADDFFLVFGDTVFDIDIERMLRFHREKHAAITLLAHPNSHPYDSDLVLVDGEGG